MRWRRCRSPLVPRVVRVPKSLNKIGNSEGRSITSSFGACGSGGGLTNKYMDGEGMRLVSTDEDSSTHDMAFSWRGLDTAVEEVCFSRM